MEEALPGTVSFVVTDDSLRKSGPIPEFRSLMRAAQNWASSRNRKLQFHDEALTSVGAGVRLRSAVFRLVADRSVYT
jgi:hypothetical protein